MNALLSRHDFLPCQNKCGKKLTPEIRAAAQVWWELGFNSDRTVPMGLAPIAQSYFCGGPYSEVKKEETGRGE